MEIGRYGNTHYRYYSSQETLKGKLLDNTFYSDAFYRHTICDIIIKNKHKMVYSTHKYKQEYYNGNYKV